MQQDISCCSTPNITDSYHQNHWKNMVKIPQIPQGIHPLYNIPSVVDPGFIRFVEQLLAKDRAPKATKRYEQHGSFIVFVGGYVDIKGDEDGIPMYRCACTI